MNELKPSPVNSHPLTPIEFLVRAATIYGDCPSVVYNDTTYTWSETHTRCVKLSSSISSLGIKSGDVVSVIAPNVPAMYELFFAVPMSGAVHNTINIRLDPRTISIMLMHCESKLVFVDVLLVPLLRDVISMFPVKNRIPLLVLIEDNYQNISSSLSTNMDFLATYEGLVSNGDSGFKWIRPKMDSDPITLSYTSGTTSAPKGVVHCHKGTFIATVTSLIEWPMPKEAVYLWTLPMFHANGWSFPWGVAAVGGMNVCMRKFDSNTVYGLIKKHRVTHMCGAPVVLNLLSSNQAEKLTSPVQILTGGAPPPAAVLIRIENLGFQVTHEYGLTETGGMAISCAWKQQWNKFNIIERAKLKARQGVGIIGVEIEVLDSVSGTPVKRDGLTIGEIVLRGGCVMLGYYKNEEETSKCMKNGWFYTGDVAVVHSDGYLEIKDRLKDVIISGGENLSSVEVESVLYMNPWVNDAAVVARPDEFWGETPCAFISLKNGLNRKPNESEIIEYCRSKLPHYMVPKTVVIEEELPKTATGKIQKNVLREIAKTMGTSRFSRM